MHAKSALRVVLKWIDFRPDSVIADVIPLEAYLIPSEKDWKRPSDAIDLDAECAYRNFNGKSHAEAAEMFVESPLVYQEDLMWMPLSCFQFYVRAYIEYLKSDKSIDDPDASNSFLPLVTFRLHQIRRLPDELKTEILDAVRFLGDNQQRYGADTEIYGSFRDHAKRILAKSDTVS